MQQHLYFIIGLFENMTSPALTQNQQRKTLSAKKGPAKGLKNVLATPHENYWPHLKHDYGASLENLLKRLLPVLKRTEQKVSWSELRTKNKEERLEAKRKAQEQSNAGYDKEAAKSIVFGINAVTRRLERDDTSIILLEVGVEPSLLVKHILAMAQYKSAPVILISFLKKVTLETVGYASAAISLNKDAENVDNYFHELYKKTSELSAGLPKSKTSISLFQNESLMQDNENQSSVEKMEQDIGAQKPVTVSTDVYLYRVQKKNRVFEPDSLHSKPNNEMKWTDFIALSDEKCDIVDQKNVPLRFFESLATDGDNDSNTDGRIQYHKRKKALGESSDSDEQSTKVTYKPLKVKRFKGNESRKKVVRKPKVKKKK